MNYSEKLQLPQWQEFRSLVLSVRGHNCEQCGALPKSPQVHHCGYKSGRQPWQYEVSEMKVLCGECHENIHIRSQQFRGFLEPLDPIAVRILLQSFRFLKEIEAKDQCLAATNLCSTLKKEKLKIELPNTNPSVEQEKTENIKEMINFFIGLGEETLDPILDGMDIFAELSELAQYRAISAVFAMLSEWESPERQ